MTSEIDNQIENYILGKLKGIKLNEFKDAIKSSPELAIEVNFQTDLSNASIEKDVMDLRSNLRNIFKNDTTMNTKSQALFDLSQNLKQSELNDDFDENIKPIESTLQFIHIENHKKNQTERIHYISTDNQNNELSYQKSITDNDLWNEISYSIKENDIIDLRNNLKQVISIGSTNINDFEIDQFLDNELTEDALTSFQNLAYEEKRIGKQIDLHLEINEAIMEKDINDLRNSINNVIEEEQMVSFSEIKRIDDYLTNQLNHNELQNFEELLSEDIRLKAETDLNFEINNAIQENNIMNLRSSLKDITSEEQSETKIRQFIPYSFTKKSSKLIGAAASVAAIVSIGAISLTQQKTTAEKIYTDSFKHYDATGLYRSNTVSSPEMMGIHYYNEHKYINALGSFSKMLNENPEHPMCNFYSGLCYQQIGEYYKAITSFQNVIEEHDNLFIEQAAWYKALCLLQTDDINKAYKSFNVIIEKNGYYSKNAKEILRKLK